MDDCEGLWKREGGAGHEECAWNMFVGLGQQSWDRAAGGCEGGTGHVTGGGMFQKKRTRPPPCFLFISEHM